MQCFALIPYIKENNEIRKYYNIHTTGFTAKLQNDNTVKAKGRWIIEKDRKSEEDYRYITRGREAIRTTNKKDG